MTRKLLRGLALAAGTFVILWFAAVAWLSWSTPEAHFTTAELDAPLRPWPPGFLWGTATAAHQIEGGNANDWTRFETQPGRVERGETSAVAAGAWTRMEADVALMQRLHANAYRFSIEWSRLEPQEGVWNEEAWARYAAFVKTLRARRITPMVTLLHFTLPAWLSERGGLLAPGFAQGFARFSAEAGKRLGPDVDLWITINEPNVQMYLGYLSGAWPPGRKSPTEAIRAFSALLRAHAAAAKALHASGPGARVGVANNLMRVEPRSRLSLPDWVAARFLDQSWNWSFADAVRDGRVRLRLEGATLDERVADLAGSADFFGLNYYFRYRVRLAPGATEAVAMEPGPGLRSELGGEQEVGDSPPEGLYSLLGDAWTRYRLPIYVTEGGIADERGVLRGVLIRGQAYAMQRALSDGVAVKGYLHWSLVDNFEWDKGYRPRFGLFRVDRGTLERTPAGGADVFTALAPRE